MQINKLTASLLYSENQEPPFVFPVFLTNIYGMCCFLAIMGLKMGLIPSTEKGRSE